MGDRQPVVALGIGKDGGRSDRRTYRAQRRVRPVDHVLRWKRGESLSLKGRTREETGTNCVCSLSVEALGDRLSDVVGNLVCDSGRSGGESKVRSIPADAVAWT